jgi:hypothetical protein
MTSRTSANYEAFIIGPTGKYVDVWRFGCGSDIEAIRRARDFFPSLGVELWRDGRIVGKYPAKQGRV